MRRQLPAIGRGLPDLIGSTPLVHLQRLFGAERRVYAKLEAFNPGGSAKDRPAMAMLQAALESGDLAPGDTVVESSSGNLGVGLAQACQWYGLEFICVVDPQANAETLSTIVALGGRLHQVLEPDRRGGDWLSARQAAVAALVQEGPRAWSPNQYASEHNPASHAQGTMREIVEQLGRPPQAILVATSTTGTLQGCQAYLRAADADTCVVAVDAVGSILFGGEAGPRTLPGFGASVLPALASSASPDLIVRVDDVDCVVGCRRFARAESLLVGASAGGVVTALEREIGRWANPRDDIVIVLHDGGARYLKTVYDDTWVEANLGLSASSVADRVVDAARVA